MVDAFFFAHTKKNRTNIDINRTNIDINRTNIDINRTNIDISFLVYRGYFYFSTVTPAIDFPFLMDE